MRRSAGHAIAPSGATEDHVIPLAHKGGPVTIPACRGCNVEKGSKSLPEFLTSSYFSKIRENKHRNQWSLRDLWLVLALAAVERASKLNVQPAATDVLTQAKLPKRNGAKVATGSN